MKSIDLINEDYDKYLKELEKTNKQFYKNVVNLLSEFVVDGTLQASPEGLARIKSAVINALKFTDYAQATFDYMGLFNKIEANNRDFYKREKITIDADSDIVKNTRNIITKALRGEDLIINVVDEVTKILQNKMNNNIGFGDALLSIENRLVQEPILSRYVSQVARDIMLQYDGAINEDVRIKNDLKYFYYIGGEVEDTRPICSHMTEKFGTKAISVDELQLVLDEFCPNGIPNKDKTTYTTVNGVSKTLQKGSGMIPDTFVANFAVNRGGYNCLHEVRYTRRPRL